MSDNEKHITTTNQQSPRTLLWQRFKRNRLALWSLRILYVLIFISIFGDFLANEKPLYCKIEGQTQFPVFHQMGVDFGLLDQTADFIQRDWKRTEYDAVIFPPIPYSPTTTDIRNGLSEPFSKNGKMTWRDCHWLGTDRLGHDLLAGLISGTRVAMLVGLISMSIAAVIGIFLGAIAGFFGDDRWKVSRGGLLLNLIGLFFAWFYAFKVRGFAIAEAGRQGSMGMELFLSLIHISEPTRPY